jgi:hypothetical protein
LKGLTGSVFPQERALMMLKAIEDSMDEYDAELVM